jgi:hypothetical protein
MPYALSALAGFGVCFAVTLLTGRKEAWDSALYFTVGIPLMCVIVYAISHAFPVRPWRWALSMAMGQAIAMMLGGGSFNLWPLAIVAMTVVSIPQFACAIVAGNRAKVVPKTE